MTETAKKRKHSTPKPPRSKLPSPKLNVSKKKKSSRMVSTPTSRSRSRSPLTKSLPLSSCSPSVAAETLTDTEHLRRSQNLRWQTPASSQQQSSSEEDTGIRSPRSRGNSPISQTSTTSWQDDTQQRLEGVLDCLAKKKTGDKRKTSSNSKAFPMSEAR